MNITIHLTAAQIILIVLVWAVVAPFVTGFATVAVDDYMRRRKRRQR